MSDSTATEPIFPVAAYDSAPLPRYEMIVLRMRYLSNSMQDMKDAEIGRFYGLSAKVARDLAADLIRHADKLDAAGPQSAPGTVQ